MSRFIPTSATEHYTLLPPMVATNVLLLTGNDGIITLRKSVPVHSIWGISYLIKLLLTVYPQQCNIQSKQMLLADTTPNRNFLEVAYMAG